MKAVIWVLTFVLGTVLNTFLGYATGIKMGAILLYLIEFYAAKWLCGRWEQHRATKQVSSDKKQAMEMTKRAETTNTEILLRVETPERKIKYCKVCGTLLVEGTMYCHKCGTRIDRGEKNDL